MEIRLQIPHLLPSRAVDLDFQAIEHWLWAALFTFYVAEVITTSLISVELGGEKLTAFVLMFVDALDYPGLVVHKVRGTRSAISPVINRHIAYRQ